MSDPMRWSWLDRYFSGECAAEEVREIERWIEKVPRRRQRIDALREIWIRAAGQPDRRWDASSAWQRLVATLDVPDAGRHRSSRHLAVIPDRAVRETAPSRHRGAVYALRLAAGIALVVGGTVIWRLAVSARPTVPSHVSNLRTYVTPRGQRASLALADGTRIVLAPGSTLQAAHDFALTGRRDVYLEGEALFEVTHRADRPFVVHTAYGTAEDLGTRFVVTAYRSDSTMRVVVAHGAVSVNGRTGPAVEAPQVLHAGELAAVDRAGQIATAHDVSLAEYFGWATGQLVFRDRSVQDVAVTLARWYDVDIQISPAAVAIAARHRVTLTTQPGQPLSEVLTALTLPVGLQVHWVDGRVVLDYGT